MACASRSWLPPGAFSICRLRFHWVHWWKTDGVQMHGCVDGQTPRKVKSINSCLVKESLTASPVMNMLAVLHSGCSHSCGIEVRGVTYPEHMLVLISCVWATCCKEFHSACCHVSSGPCRRCLQHGKRLAGKDLQEKSMRCILCAYRFYDRPGNSVLNNCSPQMIDLTDHLRTPCSSLRARVRLRNTIMECRSRADGPRS